MASSLLSYEEQREQRIERNRLVLAELGLLNNPICGTAQQKGRGGGRKEPPRPQRTAAAAAATEGVRKSRRLQQQEAELPEALIPTSDAVEGSGANRSCKRVLTMSDRALQTRIWKIRRIDKLQSFVKVLEAHGKTELAAEATQALHDLGTSPTL
ncbi:hypothetical protein N2152v2_008335 [Parachlorella kessleri]